MQSNKTILVAAAGAGKTHTIVCEALKHADKLIITTFTDKNTEEIKNRFYQINNRIPENVIILPWYTFLLKYFIRPFQSKFYATDIEGIEMQNGQSAKFKNKGSIEYYFSNSKRIYSDKIGALSCKLIEDFNDFPLDNLSKIAQSIFIDEMQDMAGYDLELIGKLMDYSNLNVFCVCDPRQSTIVTSKGRKNKPRTKVNILSFFKNKSVIIDDTSLNINKRCVNAICDLSNRLFPNFLEVKSEVCYDDKHKGIFFVRNEDCFEYISKYRPMQLTYNSRSKYLKNFPHINIRLSKGQTYNRVIIYTTEKMNSWLLNNKTELADQTRCMFYVALTRARYSVAIVYNYPEKFSHNLIQQYK